MGEYSQETARDIDNEVRRIIDEQRERVTDILAERKELLLAAGRVLLSKETITGEELRALAREQETRLALRENAGGGAGVRESTIVDAEQRANAD